MHRHLQISRNYKLFKLSDIPKRGLYLQISRNYKLFKLFGDVLFISIYKLVEIISYSNFKWNYKFFRIYKLVEIISYSNHFIDLASCESTN